MRKFYGWTVTGCLAALLAGGCGSRDKEGFEVLELAADSVAVVPIKEQAGWVRYGDKAVLRSSVSDTAWVYALPDFDSLYAFTAGEVTGGYSTVSYMPAAGEGSRAYVFDGRNYSLDVLELGSDSARGIARYEAAPQNLYMNGLVVSDTMLILGTVNFLEKQYRLSLVDPRSWTFVPLTECKTYLDERYNTINPPVVVNSAGRLALVYKQYKRIEYFSFASQGQMKFQTAAGGDYGDTVRVKAMRAEGAPMDGPTDVSWGDEFIYQLQVGRDGGGKVVATRVEVNDWSGRNRYRLQLNRPAVRILADEVRGRLYAFQDDEKGGTEQVYVYDISGILGKDPSAVK